MTVKEIAKIANVSGETVRKAGKLLYSEKFKVGKTTNFTQEQSNQIMVQVGHGFVKIMNVKEISEIAGVSTDTVRRVGKTLFPEKFENGVETVFTQDQAIQLMSKLRKPGFVELPLQSAEVIGSIPMQNTEVIVGSLKNGRNSSQKLINTAQPTQPPQEIQISQFINIIEKVIPRVVEASMTSLTNQFNLTPKSNQTAIPQRTRVRIDKSLGKPTQSRRKDLVNLVDEASKLYRSEQSIIWNHVYDGLMTKDSINFRQILRDQRVTNPNVKGIDILEELKLLDRCMFLIAEWPKPESLMNNNFDMDEIFD